MTGKSFKIALFEEQIERCVLTGALVDVSQGWVCGCVDENCVMDLLLMAD